MAELTPHDRLQPSLLDRLRDDEPDKDQESREQRVLNLRRLREAVLRDLDWLLNTGNLARQEELAPFPLVARSVLNYGMAPLAGKLVSSLDPADIERILKQAISDFEPRILRKTLTVRVVPTPELTSPRNVLLFEIEGALWAQPMPVRLFLKTEIDLESGGVTISRSEAGR